MLVEKFEEQGRRKRVERRLTARCYGCMCGLQCGPGENPWAWIRSDPVASFLASHREHCERVGVSVAFVEVDDEV